MPTLRETARDSSAIELRAELSLARTKIAELKESVRAERELRLTLEHADSSQRDQAARWLLAIEGTGVGIFDQEIASGYTEFSDRWLAITGYSRETVAPRIESLTSLVHPADLSIALADIEEVLAGRRDVRTVEYRLRHKAGHWLWVQSRNFVSSWDDRQKPLRMIGTHIDITDRRRAEDALRESETRFRVLADGAPVVLFVDGPDGGVQFVNRTYCDYFGVTPDQAEGGKWRPLVHPDDAERYLGSFMAAVHAHRPFKAELRVRRGDGEWRAAETIAEPRMSPAGEYLGHVGIIIDLTDRKVAEVERARLQQELVQAQKLESVGRLAGGVAHDFNNMLAVILGGVELAFRRGNSEHVRADLSTIRAAAERSAELTQQLLAFARQQPILPRPLELNGVLEAMLPIIRRVIGENIEISWHPAASLWRVKMDTVQLNQVITNLCVNARDAIADVGKITIAADNCSFDDSYCAAHSDYLPGEYVRLSVTDDGCGMSRESKAHLFEPFFTTKAIGKGTGLGLATVYGIVQQNKGFIQVTSEPGMGTTFELYLPRTLVPLELAAGGRSSAGVTRQRAGETILLVEDEPTLSRTYTRMLEEMGYRVVAATTPTQAIRLAEDHVDIIDLLLTDVIMPEMNGRDLAQKLTARFSSLRHLFMSGYTADIIANHGVLDTGIMFIEKPFSSEELALKVRSALESPLATES